MLVQTCGEAGRWQRGLRTQAQIVWMTGWDVAGRDAAKAEASRSAFLQLEKSKLVSNPSVWENNQLNSANPPRIQ